MRFIKGPNTWMVHAAVQSLGLAVVTAGAGNGIYLALVTDQVRVRCEFRFTTRTDDSNPS